MTPVPRFLYSNAEKVSESLLSLSGCSFPGAKEVSLIRAPELTFCFLKHRPVCNSLLIFVNSPSGQLSPFGYQLRNLPEQLASALYQACIDRHKNKKPGEHYQAMQSFADSILELINVDAQSTDAGGIVICGFKANQGKSVQFHRENCSIKTSFNSRFRDCLAGVFRYENNVTNRLPDGSIAQLKIYTDIKPDTRAERRAEFWLNGHRSGTGLSNRTVHFTGISPAVIHRTSYKACEIFVKEGVGKTKNFLNSDIQTQAALLPLEPKDFYKVQLFLSPREERKRTRLPTASTDRSFYLNYGNTDKELLISFGKRRELGQLKITAGSGMIAALRRLRCMGKPFSGLPELLCSEKDENLMRAFDLIDKRGLTIQPESRTYYHKEISSIVLALARNEDIFQGLYLRDWRNLTPGYEQITDTAERHELLKELCRQNEWCMLGRKLQPQELRQHSLRIVFYDEQEGELRFSTYDRELFYKLPQTDAIGNYLRSRLAIFAESPHAFLEQIIADSKQMSFSGTYEKNTLPAVIRERSHTFESPRELTEEIERDILAVNHLENLLSQRSDMFELHFDSLDTIIAEPFAYRNHFDEDVTYYKLTAKNESFGLALDFQVSYLGIERVSLNIANHDYPVISVKTRDKNRESTLQLFRNCLEQLRSPGRQDGFLVEQSRIYQFLAAEKSRQSS